MSNFEERGQLRSDLLAGRQPSRVLVHASFTPEAACGLAGIDLRKAHYDFSLMQKAYAAICDNFYSDLMPINNRRFPYVFQLLGAKNWVMGSTGAVQHPEIEPMLPEDYDAYIEKPYEFLFKTLLPRICTALDAPPEEKSSALAKAYAFYRQALQQHSEAVMGLSQKYGFVPGLNAGQLIEAPFDFMADMLRGFRGITIDARRIPDKVKAAVDVSYGLIMKLAVPPKMRAGIINMIPLHLAPYLNMKVFEELYWPTLERMIVELDKLGIACNLFAEQDFTRFLDYLEKLPSTTIALVEDGDPVQWKQKFGKNHVMGGFYDPTITLTKSKEQCIDAAKQLLDVCAPGGRYYFAFSKSVMDVSSVDVKKLQAVLEWVGTNAKY